jgi:pyruvate/2-oxoglutarate dehydrogenase complex dihydrolipoamide acyltransferase (E2) component
VILSIAYSPQQPEMLGIIGFFPIINSSQANHGVSAPREIVRRISDCACLPIRMMETVEIADHRVLDGVKAAHFLLELQGNMTKIIAGES